MRRSLLAALALAACGGPPLPQDLVLGPEGATTLDDLVLTVTASPEADPDQVVDYQVIWTRDGDEVRQWEDGLTVPASATTKGEVWSAEVVPVDDKERIGESRRAEIVIVNAAPTGSVDLAPAEPQTGDDLVVTATGEDPDGDAVTWTFTWLRDGAETGLTGETLSGEETGRGEVWTVVGVPSDGDLEGEPVEAEVDIANTAPVATGVSLSPAEGTEADTFVATPEGADADGDEIDWSFTWFVDSVEVDVEGDSLSGEHFAKNQAIRVEAVPSDGFVEGNTVFATAVTVNTPPMVASATIDPTPVTEGSTLSCLPGAWTDPDDDPASYRVSWEIGGTVVSTDATLTGAAFDKGQAVACVLTPWDGEVEGTAVRSSVSIVQNSPPVVASVSLDLSSPKTDDTITATATGVTDADGDDIELSFAWSVDGTTVHTTTGAATTSTLSGTDHFDKGQAVSVTVTPTDGSDDGTAVTSASVTVVNSAPVIVTASVSPSTLYTDTTASAGRGYTDADDDSLTETVAWTVNGSSAGTGTTLASSSFEKGDKVGFTLTVSDGTDSTSRTAAEVTVSNSKPTAPSVAVSPSSPGDSDDLVCQIVSAATDADDDSLTYDIDWYRDGTLWAGSTTTTTRTGDTIASGSTSAGEKWKCYAAAWDGTEYGPDGMSTEVTVTAACGNPGGGALTHDNGTGRGTRYCYSSGDSATVRARKACESHFGVGRCCVITGGYNSLQYGECGKGGGSGTIHWHPDNHPSGHCGPYYKVGDVVSPGWCGSIIGQYQ